MGQVQNKVAIVTGGASGIGAACAATLAREGAKVVVTDLDDAGGQSVVDKIGSAGGSAVFLHQDVTLEESWPGVVEATERQFGRLDVMVANAGIGIMCRAVEMTLADWRRQTAVNLDGVFLSVKHAVPAMRRAGGGSIIIMSSVAGLRGSAGLAGYCATKGGVRLFAKAVAMECAGRPAIISGSIPFIPALSTRRSGPNYRYRPGATRRSIGRGTRDRRGHDRRHKSPLELRRYRPPAGHTRRAAKSIRGSISI
jgi:NAD(P)-dependent dehydrogenase (short-subunit alcohol dehydrogenase family)